MKNLYLLFVISLFTFGLQAQEKLGFDPIIDVDFKIVDVIQIPHSPVEVQALFSGTKDSVTYLDAFGNIGKAPAREGHDFIGITQEGKDFWISVNHESKYLNPVLGDGSGMTSFKISPKSDGTYEKVSTTLADGRKGVFHTVDFVNTIGHTWTNCGGIIAPNGRIWTAEEYPRMKSWGQGNQDIMGYQSDTGDVIIGKGYIKPFVNNASQLFDGDTLEKFENQGWMVEIDPKTAKAIRKQYNWGRMSFEAGAIADDMKTVYLAEDERPGLFTKFVADNAGDFTKGKLYVYKQDGGTNGNWLEVPSDLPTMVNLKDWAWKNGATYFIRLEWVTIINNKVYIAETGYDNVTKKSSWQKALSDGSLNQIAYHHVERAKTQKHVDSQGNESTEVGTQFVSNDSSHYYDYYGRILEFDPAKDIITPYLEGGPHFGSKASQNMADYPSKHLSNPDGIGKITINGTDYLILNEDLNGSSYNRVPADAKGRLCEMYLLDMDNITNPTIDDLIRIYVGPNGSELTGGNSTNDGKTILVNIQHPSSNNDAPYNKATTIALTGWDKLADLKTANFDVSFANDSTAQKTSASGIYEQILFSETSDSVSFTNAYNKYVGLAPARGGHDFIGITQDGDNYWLTVNHETRQKNMQLGNGGGMTTFKVSRDATTDTLVLEMTQLNNTNAYFHNVNFTHTVGGTWTNCGGIIAPDGRIWTAEEYPRIKSWGQGNKDVMNFLSDTGKVIIGEGVLVPFKNDETQLYAGERLKRFESQGWMVEIDPKTGKAIRKQYNWGRMSFEAGAMSKDMKTVYLAEDERPGLFTKFVAEKAGDFTKGKLYVYKQDGGTIGNWLEVPSDMETMVNFKDWAWKNGATYFIRLEWVTEIDGKIYIAETGYDNVTKKSSWQKALADGSVEQVAYHHVEIAKTQKHVDGLGNESTKTGTQFTINDSSHYYDYYGRVLEYDPVKDTIVPYLEGGPYFGTKESQKMADYPKKHLSNPDGLGKITINGKNYLILNEDLNGATYNRVPSDASARLCEMYLLDMSIKNPTVADLTRILVGPSGAELTGGNGTPDGKAILVNVQHPSSENRAPFNHAVTLLLTGLDYVSSVKEHETNTTTEKFKIFPNPATRYIEFDKQYTIGLYDVNGKLIAQKENIRVMNISELTPGIYFIKNSEGDVKKILIE